jgi:hypothetical protein
VKLCISWVHYNPETETQNIYLLHIFVSESRTQQLVLYFGQTTALHIYIYLNLNSFIKHKYTTVVPVMRRHPSRYPYIAGVPSSEGQFNAKRQNGSWKKCHFDIPDD